MAETMSAQELSTLNEMSSAQELGKLRKISTMQDIPLAEARINKDVIKVAEENEENSQQNLDAEAERKLKTGSLKRFFRLSPKKKANDDSIDNMKDNTENEVEPVKEAENQQNTSSNVTDAGENIEKTVDSNEKKRFKLRLGKTEAPSNFDLHGNKELTGSYSKATLKSSLSTYWNSVFKLKKNKKTLKVSSDLQSDDDEAANAVNLKNPVNDLISGENNNNNLAEDIHALKISDDCNLPK